MAPNLGKFELTFVFCEFVVTTTNFLRKLVVNTGRRLRTFSRRNFWRYSVTLRTKVQRVAFVLVVGIGSKGLENHAAEGDRRGSQSLRGNSLLNLFS